MSPGHALLALLDRLDTHDAPLGAALVAASSFLEHVFPPFPGDLGVTLGAAVGFARAWPVALLFAASLLGAAVGAAVAWRFGAWLEDRARTAPPAGWLRRAHDGALDATEALDRRGVWIITASRFVPGVRGFVIVAAGYRHLPLPRVLAAALAGALAWNALLFTVAALVGRNLDALGAWLDRYNRIAGAVVVIAALAFVLHRVWRRRRSPP